MLLCGSFLLGKISLKMASRLVVMFSLSLVLLHILAHCFNNDNTSLEFLCAHVVLPSRPTVICPRCNTEFILYNRSHICC